MIGDLTYHTFQFRVNHFLEFIEKPKNNHYQIRKLVKFLKSLQNIRPILDYFSDGGFRRYVVFPYINERRKKLVRGIVNLSKTVLLSLSVPLARKFFELELSR